MACHKNYSAFFKSYGVATSFKPHTKLRKLLDSPKDPTSNIRKAGGVVYEIPCGECTKTYIGQTGGRDWKNINPQHPVANSTRRSLTITSARSPPEFSIRRTGSTPPGAGGHPNQKKIPWIKSGSGTEVVILIPPRSSEVNQRASPFTTSQDFLIFWGGRVSHVENSKFWWIFLWCW